MNGDLRIAAGSKALWIGEILICQRLSTPHNSAVQSWPQTTTLRQTPMNRSVTHPTDVGGGERASSVDRNAPAGVATSLAPWIRSDGHYRTLD